MNDYDNGYLAGISDLTRTNYRAGLEFALGYAKAFEDKEYDQ